MEEEEEEEEEGSHPHPLVAVGDPVDCYGAFRPGYQGVEAINPVDPCLFVLMSN